jgi:hypothetical protein
MRRRTTPRSWPKQFTAFDPEANEAVTRERWERFDPSGTFIHIPTGFAFRGMRKPERRRLDACNKLPKSPNPAWADDARPRATRDEVTESIPERAATCIRHQHR